MSQLFAHLRQIVAPITWPEVARQSKFPGTPYRELQTTQADSQRLTPTHRCIFYATGPLLCNGFLPRLTTAVELLSILRMLITSEDGRAEEMSTIYEGVLRKPVTETVVEVRDYLVPLTVNERVSKHRRKQRAIRDGCWHPRLKQFTFAEGKALDGYIIKPKTIKMCPDCTTFDARRHSALCNGQALKTCTTIGTPLTDKAFTSIHRDKSISFDGKYEGPFSNIDYRPLKLKFNETPKQQGMAHIISRQRDEMVLTEEFCYFMQRIERLLYEDVRESAPTYNKMGRWVVRGQDQERKPTPQAPKQIPVIREVAEREATPVQYVAKVEHEWVVVPLPWVKWNYSDLMRDDSEQQIKEQRSDCMMRIFELDVAGPRWARPLYETLSTFDKQFITEAQWRALDKDDVIRMGLTVRPKKLKKNNPPIREQQQADLMYRGHEHLPHTIGSCFVVLGDEVSVNGQLQWKQTKF